MILLTFLVLLLLVSLATLPGWSYSAKWSWYPSASCGFVALMLALMVTWDVL